MNKKGFTLIELLAVIIILAIIAIIATPIVLNVVEDARKSAGESEANMVLKGIIDHCELESIGISKTTYCKDETTLKENLDKIVNLGKLDKNDVDVSVSNNKVTSLNIKSNNNKYGLLDNKMEIFSNKSNLIDTLLKQYKEENTVGLLKDSNTNRYIFKGNDKEVPNNFLWYGGHLWRILEFTKSDDNTKKGTLKLISQQPLTTIQIASTMWDENGNGYDNNFIDKWLNEYFYKTLSQDLKNNIVKDDYKIVIPSKENPIRNGSIITKNRNIGLLDELQYTEFGGIKSYLNNGIYWILQNRENSSNIKIVKQTGEIGSILAKTAYSIRPVLSISDIVIHEGDGSLKKPYKVSMKRKTTSEVQIGDYIKVPYNGIECGSDKKCMFRVINKDSDSIKVTLNGLLSQTSSYGGETIITPQHTIYTALNNFVNGINIKYKYPNKKIFNIGVYTDGASYDLSTKTIEENKGLPVIGELLTSNDIGLIDPKEDLKLITDNNLVENQNVSKIYWTMNSYNQYVIWSVDSSSTLGGGIAKYIHGVRPVIYLNSNLEFKTGDGSPSSPYELK